MVKLRNRGQLRPRRIRQGGDVGGRATQGLVLAAPRRAGRMIERRCFLLQCISPVLARPGRADERRIRLLIRGEADVPTVSAK